MYYSQEHICTVNWPVSTFPVEFQLKLIHGLHLNLHLAGDTKHKKTQEVITSVSFLINLNNSSKF